MTNFAEVTKQEETCTEYELEVRTVSGEVLTRPPDNSPRINLGTAEHIRQEMARVYRDARSGKIETSEAGKLAYILTAVLKAHESGVIEKRLGDLESMTQPRRLR